MNETEKHMEAALVLAARVVARHGEVYLPIFERLDKELATARADATLMDRAIEIAREIEK